MPSSGKCGGIVGGIGVVVVIVGGAYVVVVVKIIGALVVVVGDKRFKFEISSVSKESINLDLFGQQTPGTNKLLKQRDSRRFLRFKSSCGQSLKSSQ